MSDLEFHVLLALGEGPSHGYAIGKAVEEQSDGQLDPTTGALYQVLRRLSDDDLIAAVPTPKDTDPRRRYFALDPARAARRGRRGGPPRRVGENGAQTPALPATRVMTIYRWLLRIAAPSLARDYGAAMEDMLAAQLAGAQHDVRLESRCGRRELFSLLAALLVAIAGGNAMFHQHKAGPMDTLGQEVHAGGTAAVAQPGIHRRHGADAGAGHRRQHRDLRGRRARRLESPPLSGFRSADRDGARIGDDAGGQRHGQHAGDVFSLSQPLAIAGIGGVVRRRQSHARRPWRRRAALP